MVDPLLVQYSTLPMTETLSAFLTILLVVLILAGRDDRTNPAASSGAEQPARASMGWNNTRLERFRSALVGFVFGLATLCRPTVWAFAPLAAVLWLIRLRQRSSLRPSIVLKSLPWPMLLGVLVVVVPWVVRNVSVLGRPILTTTHGGYTLLLGNNPVYYAEVVAQPFGTTWSDAPPGRDQKTWYDNVSAAMHRDLGADATETERDRYQYRLAYSHIASQPGLFARACMLRLIRFWDIAPQGSESRQLPPVALLGDTRFLRPHSRRLCRGTGENDALRAPALELAAAACGIVLRRSFVLLDRHADACSGGPRNCVTGSAGWRAGQPRLEDENRE